MLIDNYWFAFMLDGYELGIALALVSWFVAAFWNWTQRFFIGGNL